MVVRQIGDVVIGLRRPLVAEAVMPRRQLSKNRSLCSDDRPTGSTSTEHKYETINCLTMFYNLMCLSQLICIFVIFGTTFFHEKSANINVKDLRFIHCYIGTSIQNHTYI